MNNLRNWITLCEARKRKVYIRFGDIPENEQSHIGAAPNIYKALYQKSNKESGVSVYDAEWNASMARWFISDPGNGTSLCDLLSLKRPAFLVTGRELKNTGMDGEPLLKDVQIVEEVPYNKIWIEGWGDDGYAEEFLEPDADGEPIEEDDENLWEKAEPYKNSTPRNALDKIEDGYKNGFDTVMTSCYMYVGAELARLNPSDATIRLWGLNTGKLGVIVHADAILSNGDVISDIPVEKYTQFGYQLVYTFLLSDFKKHI